jgi:hypothetical protein
MAPAAISAFAIYRSGRRGAPAARPRQLAVLSMRLEGFARLQGEAETLKPIAVKDIVARVRHLNDKKKPDHWRSA